MFQGVKCAGEQSVPKEQGVPESKVFISILTALATKESTQVPPPVSTVSAGPRMVNASKSSLNAQTPRY